MSQINSKVYEPESARDFFNTLEKSLTLVADYRKAYNVINRVFQQCVDQNTSGNNLHIFGPFAKTDYLLKEHGASKEMCQHANDTRVRLRKRVELAESDLEKWFYHDLRNIAQFVSFIYDEPIPVSLSKKFPATDERHHSRELLKCEKLRVIVERWDNDFVYASADNLDDVSEVKIRYSKDTESATFDWSYLRDMFRQGTQLNLIRPREREGVVYPELIIFEPDYLVDISTVAHCFTNYAESPLVNLIKKLEPSHSTEATVMGNFAGQLLDEQLHKLPDGHTYKDSVKTFWQNHAIGLLTVGIGASFHDEAQRQQKNIAKAVNKTLAHNISSFDPQECMVEPSFFSEMLGLQGRMDMLQMDYKLLLEQKSGKGEFPYDNFRVPKFKEEHYVQMLLYMMIIRYNFREIYEQNDGKLHAFLLYSKYAESLCGLSWAPELMFRAIKVRNGIAWTEMQLMDEDTIKMLGELTPEQLNIKKINNTLWNKYQRQQIAEVLEPIRQSSELERAYFYRFFTFIANEHVLSKMGNQSKENSGFAAKWYDTLEEKLQAGNIYDRLTLVSPNEQTEGNIEEVCLSFSETESNDMSNFRTGDIVILYAYDAGKEPDARKSMVFRCTIKKIESGKIDLSLRAAQSNKRVFLRDSHRQWAIEHDFIEASYASLYRGMQAFLSAPQSRKDLVLLQREPETDERKQLNGDYGTFNDLMLRVKQANDLFLIIGPPGTGKTSFGLMNTLKEQLTEPDSSVLLLSYTNRAVDEICSKLHREKIDFIRLGGDMTCSPEYKDNLLSNRAQQCSNIEQLRQLIAKTRVIAATTTAMNSQLSLLKLKQFSLAIVDEASQILEPHLLGILSAHNDGKPSIAKMVLIGDHKQLPAVVQQTPEVSKVNDKILWDINLTDCRLSLFERMLRRYHQDPKVVYMLNRQGRMHHDIAAFPNQTFYNSALEEVPLKHQNRSLPLAGTSSNGIDNILRTRRIAFINADLPSNTPSDKVNQIEADIIAATVLRIYEIEKAHFDATETIGVIVPYRNQIAAIRNTIEKYGNKTLRDITIDTVERYQGSQRKYIIYGFTVQLYYQMKFLTNNVFEDWDGSIIDRKLNVAITRAEEHLIMVGNATLLSANYTFSKLIEYLRAHKSYFEIAKDRYVAGDFDVPALNP